MLQAIDLTITLNQNLRVLLERFTFTLQPGDRAVIIGEEGNGKSTLLALLYDEALVRDYASYTGSIRRDGMRLGYLYQELPAAALGQTVYEYLYEHGAFDSADPKALAAIAHELRVPEELLYADQPLAALSGGEKVKVQMVRLLAAGPDALLLDEPTNDIDIETLEWLEQFLLRCPLPVLYVSHDETLIERTANRVVHIEQVRKKTTPRHTIANLPYAVYLDQRRRTLAHDEQVARKEREDYADQMARWQKIHDEVERQQATITRQNPSGARLLKKKMKSVLSQQRRYEREKEDFTPIPEVEDAIFASFGQVQVPNGKEILRFALPALTIGDRVLATGIELQASGPAHIGIIGRNGVGKTTLLRRIAEALLARTDLKAAYMPQNYWERLDPAQSPVDYLAPSGRKDDVTRARTYLGSLKYRRDEMTQPIAALSGGQKAKLLLLKMILDGCNVLVLDEPTRNFSPLSGPVVRGLLASFGGAILSVTHDRKYLREVCDTVYRLESDGLHRVYRTEE